VGQRVALPAELAAAVPLEPDPEKIIISPLPTGMIQDQAPRRKVHQLPGEA